MSSDPSVPPACPACDDGEFKIQDSDTCQEFRGETLHINTPMCVCQRCGFQVLAEGQLDELVLRTHAAYNVKIANRAKALLNQNEKTIPDQAPPL